MVDLEALDLELKAIRGFNQQMVFLSQLYPGLYLFVLTQTKQEETKNRFIEKCKTYENDPYRYSIYIHGYLIPWFD